MTVPGHIKISGAITQGLKRLAFGSGDLGELSAKGGKRLIGSWGSFDDDLYRARILRDQLAKAGVDPQKLKFMGQEAFDPEKVLGVEREFATLPERAWKRLTFQDTPSPEEAVGQIRKSTGFELTPEQFESVTKQRRSPESYLRSAKDLVWGEAPIQTIGQRYQYGGLIGKGGVLTADLAPTIAMRRAYKRVADQARAGNYGEALKRSKYLVIPTGAYGANLAFNYGLPALGGYEAIQAARESGESPLRAAGGALTGAAANIGIGPFGLAQIAAYEPLMGGIQRAWGIGPETATGRAWGRRMGEEYPTAVAKGAPVAARQLIPGTSSLSRAAGTPSLPFPTPTG